MTAVDRLRRLGAAARAVLLLSVLLVVEPARADDADLLGIVVKSKVQIGDRPALQLRPQVPVKSVAVRLVPTAGGPAIVLKSGPLSMGSARDLPWNQDVGTREWKAALDVVYGDGTKSASEITITTTVYPKIASSLTKADVDLGARSLALRLNQPAAKVEIRVLGDDGKVMHEGATLFDGEEPGTPLVVSWEQPEGVAVLKIDVKAWSQSGFWVGTEVTPFEVEIPHEDVEFEFGRSDVTPEQAPKIDHTLDLLRDKVQRYGGFVKLQLYIAGYTDTVGPRSSNRELSEARARSIAAYFRKKGVAIPIYFQGFGEDVLAVQTPDETREARNRRAVYVLSASPPAIQPAIPRADWKPL